METSATQQRQGLWAALGAFGIWGMFPLFFTALQPAGALEISAHRVLWSFATCVIVLTATGALSGTWRLIQDRRLLARLAIGSFFLAANWLIFVVAVELDLVVDAALGYFLNPLVSVALAVLILRERPRPLQWSALAIAGIGALVMVVGLGRVPWIAFSLAFSFGLYGLIKKQVAARVTAMPGLAIETTVMLVPAVGYLTYLIVSSGSTFGADVGLGGTTGHALLLVSSGAVSSVPLLLFAAAARRLPLATVAMTQFITPVLQLLVGVVILGEPMSTARWLGFGFVWLALLILTVDIVHHARARPAVNRPTDPHPADAGTTPRSAPE
ncbi:MAG: EamA family transporter RarD [Beutenbergiaceae bacterium]